MVPWPNGKALLSGPLGIGKDCEFESRRNRCQICVFDNLAELQFEDLHVKHGIETIGQTRRGVVGCRIRYFKLHSLGVWLKKAILYQSFRQRMYFQYMFQHGFHNFLVFISISTALLCDNCRVSHS